MRSDRGIYMDSGSISDQAAICSPCEGGTRTQMRSRWRSRPVRPVRPLSRKKIWMIAILIMLFFCIQTYIYVEKNIKPHLLSLASFRLKQISTETINSAITQRIANTTDLRDLVDWKLDANGDISGFSLNYAQHLKIAADTVEHVEQLLQQLSKRPERVPLGLALGSTIFASSGPDIPIRFEPLGHAKVELKSRERDAGINMLLVEIYMQIHAEVMMIIPFHTQPEVIALDVPISYMLVVGDVPMYYFDNKGNPAGIGNPAGVPNISLPAPPTGAEADGNSGGREAR